MTRQTNDPAPRLPVPAGELPRFTPVPRQHERHDGWTPERQHAFIEALADTGSVKAAAKAVNMSQPGAYQLRRAEGAESFRDAWQRALDLGIQRIEDVAMDRALNGIEVPVYSYGKLVGQRTVHNDRLLMFMLRNRAPSRFGGVGAKGMGGLNAVGKMELERLKKKWRAEWEEEKKPRPEEDVLDSLNKKLSRMHKSYVSEMSPRTKAAFDEYNRLKDLDEAEGYDPRKDPEHQLYRDYGRTRQRDEKPSETTEATNPPKTSLPQTESYGQPGPKIRMMKDGARDWNY